MNILLFKAPLHSLEVLLGALLLLLMLSSPSLAEPVCQPANDSSRRSLQEVSKTYSALEAMKADFEQTSFFLGLGDTVVSTGNLAFMRPGKMDWVYESPEKQRFVADGKNVWFFQPELNQVTVGLFESAFSSDLPVSFLVGVGNISSSFDLTKFCKSSDVLQYYLKPKNEDPNLKTFVLFVEAKSNLVTGARVVDVGGNETEIILKNLKPGIAIEKERFVFQIPKGVDVINQTNLGSGNIDGDFVNE